MFAQSATVTDHDHIARRIRFLARLMDSAVPIPGTRATIGIDPVLGLFPGLGDAVSAGVSIYIWVLARRLGAPPAVLRQMAANIVLDVALGLVPVAGDAADFVFKANTRNLELLGLNDADARRSPPRRRTMV